MSKLSKWRLLDTNVAIVANGGSEQASPALAEKCIDVLLEITRGNGLVLDADGEIFEEYRRNLSLRGQPGVGDMFLKWVHDNQWNPERCERRMITPLLGDSRGYEEFPASEALADFDASDRKFVVPRCFQWVSSTVGRVCRRRSRAWPSCTPPTGIHEPVASQPKTGC